MMDEADKDNIGRVVISNAGRDKGRAFIIVGEEDAQHVLLADGCLRKLGKPKKKKRKHLRFEPATAENIKAKLIGGKQVFDAEIRNCLMSLGYKLE